MKIIYPQSFTLTSSNIASSSYSEWNSTASYAIGNIVYLNETKGEYKCLVANSNKKPSEHLYDVTNNPNGEWSFIGTTNKYKMFDQYLNTQSTNANKIEIQLLAVGFQALFLGNLTASSISIQIIDNNTLEVIETFEKGLTREINSWFDYFFGDWKDNRKDSFVFIRQTATRNVSIAITIDNGSNTAACGVFLCGNIKEAGVTKWDLSVGALDYSTVVVDTSSGSTFLSEGNYAKTLDIDIFVKTALSMDVYKMLTDARGKPVVFMAGYSDDLSIYGYIQKFETVLKSPIETAITANIIGLI